MAKIESALWDIGYLDTLSYRETPLQRLDPRAKLLTTFMFILTVVSFPKSEISGLIPLVIYPVALMAVGNLPATYLLKKMLLLAPFALFIGIFNPLFDREVVLYLGPVGITGGWISFASIMIRFALTVAAALILIASTGLNAVCAAIEKLGVPRIFAVQLLFLYRYIFVLVEESLRLVRAQSLRSFEGRGKGIRIFGYLIGQLLLRTMDRAQRIHRAMICRGFEGEIRLLRPLKMRKADVHFLLFWGVFFAAARVWNIPYLLGRLITG